MNMFASLVAAAALGVGLVGCAHAHPHHPRAAVIAAPVTYQVVKVGRKTFYYHDGHYYRRKGRSYVVVAAPIGAVIPALPARVAVVGQGRQRYYHARGVYYRKVDRGYVVINRPR